MKGKGGPAGMSAGGRAEETCGVVAGSMMWSMMRRSDDENDGDDDDDGHDRARG